LREPRGFEARNPRYGLHPKADVLAEDPVTHIVPGHNPSASSSVIVVIASKTALIDELSFFN
jgi:hypothetical protein